MTARVNPFHLSPKRRGHNKRRSLSDILKYEPETGSERNFLMYSLRHLALDDKISEQISIGVLTQIYPTETLYTLLEQSPEVQQKPRRVRHFVPISVIWFLLMMALWTRLSQARVWDKLTHKLVVLHPDETLKVAGASALSYQRQLLGDDLLRRLMELCCRPLCSPETPGAFYQGHRL